MKLEDRNWKRATMARPFLFSILYSAECVEGQFSEVRIDGVLGSSGVKSTLERVMNSIRNGLGMRKTEIAREPSRPRNPHFYAIFAQVRNTL